MRQRVDVILKLSNLPRWLSSPEFENSQPCAGCDCRRVLLHAFPAFLTLFGILCISICILVMLVFLSMLIESALDGLAKRALNTVTRRW